MRAVVYRGPGEVEVQDVPVPRPLGPRDAVVRVTRAAVCGTDLHPYRGELPGFPAGTVLGHEFAGRVHEAGPEVPFAVGERVFASDVIACGRCSDCLRGRHYQCGAGSLFGYADVAGPSVAGGQAQYVRVPFADVVLARTPDSVTDEQALFVGDVLTTAYAGVRAARCEPGDVLGVVGAGPVGVLAARCGALAGAAEIVVAEPDARRRQQAAEFGVRAVAPADFAEALRAATGGRGADAVIEAVGSDTALACALDATGPCGTVVALGAHHSTAMPFPTGQAFARELSVRFTVGNPIALRDRVLGVIRAGVDPGGIVTHRLPLEAAAEAYRLFDRHRAFKVVLECAS
ncbi:dehydrogenase [Streptomyces olivaceoviridis]|uniref:alcohol dehydrogenase catalytic domain-containing protein n=1 Tax=Streptomyces olivaceoviridis TaxID=1921 RepID=UPI001671C308|nr:alcohol dehydrogenase catalytic domain-containing protein [Streptomyces olivaceoviridis]GGZ09249.1 dehydrogenase [Streptomyces olivaceoviridis]